MYATRIMITIILALSAITTAITWVNVYQAYELREQATQVRQRADRLFHELRMASDQHGRRITALEEEPLAVDPDVAPNCGPVYDESEAFGVWRGR